MRRLVAAAALAVALGSLTACESGTRYAVALTIDADARDALVDAQPGAVIADVPGAGLFLLDKVCGEALATITWSEDVLFACAPSHGESACSAVIAPLPEDWDAEAFCALERDGSGRLTLLRSVVPESVQGDMLLLLPSSSAPVLGAGTGTWAPDLSPCGGTFTGSATLSLR
jgi:hypothetical protein